MPRIFFTLLLLFSGAALMAQGNVRGTVSDPSGETIIGASVKVKELPGVYATTDLDGAYSLRLPDAQRYTIAVSFVMLNTGERTVSVSGGQTTVLDFALNDAKGSELGPVVVERKARSTSDVRLERLKINSAASIDYISGEAMLRTGDGDANAAVKRVTGVSTAGAFVTVRGLADRYLVTTINGGRVPTLDPLTNNLRLDIFPTGLLDNIVITKTATPELPGDWSGALISLNTSDYPDKLRVSVSSTFGYNPQSSFKPIIGSARSSTDWLGRDDGMRAIPDGVPSDIEDFPGFVNPGLYQQLGLLGIGAQLAGYGITANTPGFQETNMSGTNQLQNLALTELGLLAPALINDPAAAHAAAQSYNSTYGLSYFSPLVNGRLADLNARFDNANWRVKEVQGLPNFQQALSIGNSVELFKKAKTPKTLGFLFGFRYASETEYDGASTMERNGQDRAAEDPGAFYDFKGEQRISTESNGWNALGSLSLKIDRNNTVSLLAMPNVLGQNNTRYQVFKKPSISGETFVSEDQFYEQRKLWLYQFGSRHFVPAIRLKVDVDLSWSKGSRDLLDMKTVQYILPEDGGIAQVDGALVPPSRIYRFLDETLLDGRVAFQLPLGKDERKARALRFGGAYREDTRRNNQAYFTVLRAPGPSGWEDPGRFELSQEGTFASQYSPFGTFKDSDIGISKVLAGFVMSDYAISPRLRAVGGVRAEHTDLLADIQRYHEMGLSPTDSARGTVGDLAMANASGRDPKPANAGVLDQWDLLPSVNLIYKLKDDEFAPMNLRLNWYRSLARPSFREFSVVQLWDYQLNATVFGNPDLKMTSIDNYDIRLERFFKNRNNISVSAFYKRFRNHIELLSTIGSGFTWRNADLSRIYGVEVEGRIGIGRQLEWRGNVTWMDSRSDLSFNITGEEVKYSTAMFGQAPWIVNSMLTWTLDSAKFYVSASYNVQGPRLAVTNSELAPDNVRAYEMPRHLVDITLNKSFGAHWGLRLRARNLLNAPVRRAYKFDSGYRVDFDRYAWGSEYQLTVSYAIR